MEPNKQLSICIPTYNRASVLENLLIDLIPKVAPYQVSIYISDNNSPDITEQVVIDAQQRYSQIFYQKNTKNIGADRNFEQVLKMSHSEYSWLLGDDDRITDNGVELILSLIQKKPYDVIITNGCNREKTQLKNINIISQEYSDYNNLLTDMWHTMTWMSTLIYSKEIIQNANFHKYYDSNFLQTAIIFEYIAMKDNFIAYWNSQPLVSYPNEDEIINSYTNKKLFLFLKCWTDVILKLPSNYNPNSKHRSIKSSSISFQSLAKLRMNGYFNFDEFKLYITYFKYVIKAPILLIGLLSITPKLILKIIYLILYKSVK